MVLLLSTSTSGTRLKPPQLLGRAVDGRVGSVRMLRMPRVSDVSRVMLIAGKCLDLGLGSLA